MRPRALPSWLLLLLGLAACPADPAAIGPGASGSLVRLESGAACSVDAECEVGLVCDSSRRVCVCTSDASCVLPLLCNPFSGRCVTEVPGCRSDHDCGAWQWCDLETRVCQSRASFCGPCSRDEACGSGNRCILGQGSRGFCGRSCGSDSHCPEHTRCIEGQCIPDTSCAALVPCTPDSLQPCQSTADCTEGRDQLCEASVGQCVARQSGCAPGKACNPLRECVPSCLSDANCDANERCLNALCRRVEFCTRDESCSEDKVCRLSADGRGECIPSCMKTADCPLGQLCTLEDGRRACREGCAEDKDCAPVERCDPSSRRCVGGGAICQATDLCGPCETCRDGSCVFSFDENFPDRRYCAPCETDGSDADCGLGGFCIEGRCAPPCPEAGCPRGFFCKRLIGEGGVIARGCYPNDGICDTECM